MKWNRPTVIAVAAVLTMPLLMALGGLRWWRKGAEVPSRDMVPSLSLVERRKLLTFEQCCQKPEDCEPPLACLDGFRDGVGLCLDSECTTDLQCEEAFACRSLRTVDGKRLLRTCVPAGKRKEGEPCRKGVFIVDDACERGLRCNLFCGRPCVLGMPLACPEGFVCLDGADGPSCQPTCEQRGCPGGQECVPMGTGTSICTFVVGENCERHPCSGGTSCRVGMPALMDEGMVTNMECVQRCGEGKPPCPDGSVCWGGSCRRQCDPEVPGACGLNRECHPLAHGKTGVCRLALPEEPGVMD